MKLCFFITLFSLLIFSSCKTNEPLKNSILFVGTYTENGSEGIYSYTFNATTGELSNKILAAPMGNPSFLEISPNKKYLYAVEETDRYEGSSGGVAAFSIEGASLKAINSDATLGAHPCHIGISEDGHYLAASSYSGGSVSIFKLGNGGELMSDPQFIDHKVLDTTKTSHAHAAKFTKDGLFVADLGLDALKRYTLEEDNFVPSDQPTLDLPLKAGPRHFTFGQDGKYLYVINELNSTLTVFQRDADGTYTELQTQTTLAPDFEGDSYCADIHLSKDGKFLYGSNRGENTIVIFKVNQDNGKISLVGRESIKGDWPRNFGLDPSGNFLLVANQKSNNIVVFKRDAEQGTLSFLNELELPSPVCLEFLE
ncbi:MAG: lactonase family protein [Maribacter sp.]|nr:lactonase family protein [Maribacter sp.]